MATNPQTMNANSLQAQAAELTATRQALRSARRDFISEFTRSIEKLFGELNASVDKFRARRSIMILVDSGIEHFLSELSRRENTKEDVEHISIRLLGFVTCHGWERYEEVMYGITCEYSWRQQHGNSNWKMPQAVRAKIADVEERRDRFERGPMNSNVVSITAKEKPNKPSRREIDARRAANRQERLSRQPVKGKSPPPPNGFKNPAGKKRGK